MSIGSIAPTYERRRYVDFLVPYQDLDTTFTIYQAQPQTDIFHSLKILTFHTSLGLFLTWGFSTLFSCFSILWHKPQNKWHLLSDVGFYIWGSACRQSKSSVCRQFLTS